MSCHVPKEGKELKTKAQRVLDGGDKPFFPEHVTKSRAQRVVLEKQYIVLTQSEVEKTCQHKMKAKDPALKVISMKDLDGSEQSFYVFADEANPWRRLKVTSEMAADNSVWLMEQQNQLHQEQGKSVATAAFSTTLSESAVKGLLGPGSSQSVVSIAEYQKKLQKKYGVEVKKELDISMSDKQEIEEHYVKKKGDEQSAMQPGVEAGDECEDEEEDDGAEEEAESSVAVASVRMERQASQHFSTTTKEAQSSSGKKKPRRVWGKSPSLPASSSVPEKVEATSGKDVDVYSDRLSLPDQYLSDPEIVQKWSSKLSLQAGLSGEKLGVIRNHALNAVKKLEPAFKNMLAGHVKLWDWAKRLSADESGTCSQAELLEAVSELKGHIDEWPPASGRGEHHPWCSSCAKMWTQ